MPYSSVSFQTTLRDLAKNSQWHEALYSLSAIA